LGRIIGLIGCTCLVIIALRMTNLQHSDHTLKGGEDRVHAGGRLSPREHYKLGKEMYLRGKYRDAVQHLDAASAATSGLTGTELPTNTWLGLAPDCRMSPKLAQCELSRTPGEKTLPPSPVLRRVLVNGPHRTEWKTFGIGLRT
jgi:hypothetical protein